MVGPQTIAGTSQPHSRLVGAGGHLPSRLTGKFEAARRELPSGFVLRAPYPKPHPGLLRVLAPQGPQAPVACAIGRCLLCGRNSTTGHHDCGYGGYNRAWAEEAMLTRSQPRTSNQLRLRAVVPGPSPARPAPVLCPVVRTGGHCVHRFLGLRNYLGDTLV